MVKLYTSDDDEKVKKLTKLNKGDKIYTLEIQHDGEKEETEVKIRELEFVEYEHEKSSKIEIEEHKDDDAIMATIKDPKFPKVEIKHQDISTGYFFSPLDAVEASIEIFEKLLILLKDKAWDLKTKK